MLILGSTSKSRRNVLEEAKIPFVVRTSPIDEKSIGVAEREAGNATELVEKVAMAKMHRLVEEKIGEDTDIVVTCDQVCLFEGKILEKPESEEEARNHLTSVETVLCMVVRVGDKIVSGRSHCILNFGEIPDSVIDSLIKKGDIFKACGSFTIEDGLLEPWFSIVGRRDSCTGFDVELFNKLLSN